MTSINKRLAELNKPLSTVSTRELSLCIYHGVRDRLHSGAVIVGDGGPVRVLKREIDAWHEANSKNSKNVITEYVDVHSVPKENAEILAWRAVPHCHQENISKLLAVYLSAPPGSIDEGPLEAFRAAKELLESVLDKKC